MANMTPYIVAAIFVDGPLVATAVIAPDPTMAAAASTMQILRETQTQAELAGIIVVPLAAEFLTAALSALRGQPSGGVVSLFRPDERAPTAHDERAARSLVEQVMFGGSVPQPDEHAATVADRVTTYPEEFGPQPPPVVA
jgi:hypothetical protein